VAEVGAAAERLTGGTAIRDVAATFTQEFDKEGNIVKQASDVLGRTWVETFEEFQDRVKAENILSVLDSVLPQFEANVLEIIDLGEGLGSITVVTKELVGQASAISERYKANAAELLEGAKFLLLAVTDIQNGVGLLGDLGDIDILINDLKKSGETLSDTYVRVVESTNILQEVIDTTGVVMDKTREEFVRFATDISEAAGSTQEAARLWQSYFGTFYDSNELIGRQLEQAKANRDTLLNDLGFTQGLTSEQFRDLFEQNLPNLSAEATVEWLRAADAIGAVIDLEAELAKQRESFNDLLADI